MQNFRFSTVLCQFDVFSCGVLPESGGVDTPAGTPGVKNDADRLPVVVRFPAGPQVSLKCGDQSKDTGAGHKKKIHLLGPHLQWGKS